VTWITAALSLLGRIPGLLGALKALFAGGLGAWVMHRRQQQAQELEDAKAERDREKVDAGAVRAGGDAARDWLLKNRRPR
jgi:hypothetical protein